MLPLLRDELNIEFFPSQVSFLRHSRVLTWRGIQRRLVRKTHVTNTQPVADELPWNAALRALSGELPAWLEGKPVVRVIVSNHFVRYALLPWSDALSDAAEEEIYARHYFRELYGAEAANWDMRISHAGIDLPQMASALDDRLLQALRALFAQHGASLYSLQPALMAVYNNCRVQLAQASGWLVIHEAGCLCLALLQHGQWRSVRTLRSIDNWLQELPRLLERETYLAVEEAAACEQIYMWAPSIRVPATAGRWQILALQPELHGKPVPVNDVPCALALSE